jgi:hypothetical protein
MTASGNRHARLIPVGRVAPGALWIDVNRDGRIDAVVATKEATRSAAASPSCPERAASRLGFPGGAGALRVSGGHDSGRLIEGSRDPATVRVGDGGSRPSPAPDSPFAVGHAPLRLAIGHIDGDGTSPSLTAAATT